MRYIGSKAKLIDEIHSIINQNITLTEDSVFCDIFSGTGTVAESFRDKCKVIVNDSLYASYCVSKAKTSNTSDYFVNLSFNPIEFFNNLDSSNYIKGFCYNNFAPTVSGRQYFTDDNAKFIDLIRDTIDVWYDTQMINIDEKEYLIGCLIESASKVANVAGVYSAYLHIWDPRAINRMVFLQINTSDLSSDDNKAYNYDVLDLIENISGDVLYIDPPYTATQYISQYHVLETIARNDFPIIHGLGAHRDNGKQISDWCKKAVVEKAFYQLIKKANFKYIVMSYSDAGLMSKEYIENVLKRFAKQGTYKLKKIDFVKYKNTRAVKREIKEKTKDKKHFEWLFIIEKGEDINYISPLNYIGGKYDVINFIKSNLPNNISTFYDLFGGGATVSLNVEANSIVYNDNNWIVCNLLQFLAINDIVDTCKEIANTIKKYKLSKGNKVSYIELRNDYNIPLKENRNQIYLYLLICFGFEHQIRFNNNYEFNNPCGNSGFNADMLEKLISYNDRVSNINISFNHLDYKEYINLITPNDFVYCDPPYLATCGAYNDGKRGFNGWDINQQHELLNFLDTLTSKNIHFMLSNYKEHSDNDNNELLQWAKEHNYKIIINDAITKRNRQNRRELIIINY